MTEGTLKARRPNATVFCMPVADGLVYRLRREGAGVPVVAIPRECFRDFRHAADSYQCPFSVVRWRLWSDSVLAELDDRDPLEEIIG